MCVWGGGIQDTGEGGEVGQRPPPRKKGNRYREPGSTQVGGGGCRHEWLGEGGQVACNDGRTD